MTRTEDIKKLAINVFNDTDKAEEWLITPLKSLSGQSPLSKIVNAKGIEEVKALLRKIENGEFI